MELEHDREYLVSRDGQVVGTLGPQGRVDLEPEELDHWEAARGNLEAFRRRLGPGYTIVEITPEGEREGRWNVNGLLDRRRYMLLHNGEIIATLDAFFRNGEFAYLQDEEEVVAELPEALQDRWREVEGDLSAFLLALEEEEHRFNYLEAMPDETPEEVAAEQAVDREAITLHWERGLSCRDRYLFLRALREFEIAAALCDKYALIDFLAELCNEMGNIYIAFEDYDTAVEVLEEGVAYEPVDVVSRVRLLTNLSQAYELAGKRAKAIERVETAMQIIPADIYDSLLAGVYSQAASLYNQEGNYQKAIQLYKLALYLADNSSSVSDQEKAMFHNNLGMAYLEHKDFANAREHLKRAVELQPEDEFYLENMDRIGEEEEG